LRDRGWGEGQCAAAECGTGRREVVANGYDRDASRQARPPVPRASASRAEARHEPADSALLRLQLLDVLEHHLGMALRVHVLVVAGDLAFRVDQERIALGELERAQKALEHAVLPGHDFLV